MHPMDVSRGFNTGIEISEKVLGVLTTRVHKLSIDPEFGLELTNDFTDNWRRRRRLSSTSTWVG